MKKTLFLIISLLSVGSAACFTGCNVKGDSNNETVNDGAQTGITSVEDEGASGGNDGTGETCPDCEKHNMPKVHFEFKYGRPSCKRDGENDGGRERGALHGNRRDGKKRPHKKPAPTPPVDDDYEENAN